MQEYRGGYVLMTGGGSLAFRRLSVTSLDVGSAEVTPERATLSLGQGGALFEGAFGRQRGLSALFGELPTLDVHMQLFVVSNEEELERVLREILDSVLKSAPCLCGDEVEHESDAELVDQNVNYIMTEVRANQAADRVRAEASQ